MCVPLSPFSSVSALHSWRDKSTLTPSDADIMGCVSSKQKELFLDQNGQEIAVPKRATWRERKPVKKERPATRKARGPPSPVVENPAPWLNGHALLMEKDGRLTPVERHQAR